MFGASLAYPVIRSRQQTLNVGLAFDALDSDISVEPQGTPRTQASYDALRIMRVAYWATARIVQIVATRSWQSR